MKRTKIISFILTASILIFFVFHSSHPVAAVEYIDISNPFLRKIPLSIPWFKNISQNAKGDALSVELADLLSDSLEFTGYFKILDRSAFLVDPKNPEIIASRINFRNWTVIGAEVLVTGGISVDQNLFELELRLFDTVNGKLLVGKRYRGQNINLKSVIRRFCSEVMLHLTGSRGMFDSKIAFISALGGKKEVYLCEFDGNNITQFTHHGDITLFPAWSSDSKWIAYTSYVNGSPDLFIRKVGEQKGVFIDKKGIQITPDWVPGKFQLAATLSFSGDQEIYLLTGEGKIIKRLTNSRGIDVEPAWSPDGEKMAFVSKRSGTPQIYIMDTRSLRVRRLTFNGRYNTQPSWSPKGDRIAYSAMENGRIDICTIKVDGSEWVRLTENQGDNEAPSWSPDGSLIVFSSTREGRSKIYVMTAFGTDQRRLISLPGEQSNPKWSQNAISK
jgi:TolB protein